MEFLKGELSAEEMVEKYTFVQFRCFMRGLVSS